jgi:hypothetical protein
MFTKQLTTIGVILYLRTRHLMLTNFTYSYSSLSTARKKSGDRASRMTYLCTSNTGFRVWFSARRSQCLGQRMALGMDFRIHTGSLLLRRCSETSTIDKMVFSGGNRSDLATDSFSKLQTRPVQFMIDACITRPFMSPPHSAASKSALRPR